MQTWQESNAFVYCELVDTPKHPQRPPSTHPRLLLHHDGPQHLHLDQGRQLPPPLCGERVSKFQQAAGHGAVCRAAGGLQTSRGVGNGPAHWPAVGAGVPAARSSRGRPPTLQTEEEV